MEFQSLTNGEFSRNFIIENKDSITSFYTISDKLGEGSFGEVRLAVHKKTHEIRAIKIIYKDKLEVKET